MEDRSIYRLRDAGITLEYADVDADVTSYVIKPGTVAVAADAFADVPFISEITIPFSLRFIAEGALSNGGSWADEHRGITKVNIDSGNFYFKNIDNCFCSVLSDGSYRLLRVAGSSQTFSIPKEITSIGKDSFKGCTISEAFIEAYGISVFFPVSHAYFLSLLLEGFGKNEKLYDFSDYDAFLLRNHFNEERIRMIRARLEHPYDCSPEIQNKLRAHVCDNFEDVTEMIVKSGTTAALDDLSQIGFFTGDNIDECIDILNRANKDELKMWLLEFKNSRFGFSDFDFNL